MDARLEQLKASLEKVVEGASNDLLRRKVPGKWCAAEVLEHLYLTYTGTIRGLEKVIADGAPRVSTPTLRHRVATLIVVGLRHMPAGRKTPEVAAPKGLSEAQVRSEIGAKVVEMDALLAECQRRFGRRKVLDHPILGPLSAPQWRTLHVVHGRHHHKQLRTLLGK